MSENSAVVVAGSPSSTAQAPRRGVPWRVIILIVVALVVIIAVVFVVTRGSPTISGGSLAHHVSATPTNALGVQFARSFTLDDKLGRHSGGTILFADIDGSAKKGFLYAGSINAISSGPLKQYTMLEVYNSSGGLVCSAPSSYSFNGATGIAVNPSDNFSILLTGVHDKNQDANPQGYSLFVYSRNCTLLNEFYLANYSGETEHLFETGNGNDSRIIVELYLNPNIPENPYWQYVNGNVTALPKTEAVPLIMAHDSVQALQKYGDGNANLVIGGVHYDVYPIGAADVNGDGQEEIFAVRKDFSGSRRGGPIGIYGFNQKGEVILQFSLPDSYRLFRLVDLDGDGTSEIVLSLYDSEEVDVLKYTGDSTLLQTVPFGNKLFQ